MRTSRWAAVAGLAALLLTTATGCSSGQVDDGAGGNGQAFVEGSGTVTVIPAAKRPAAPALVGPTLDGSTYRLADHRGQVVVVNVWGSWCAPCRAEAPTLASLSRRLRSDGVAFVGINTRDQDAAARAFAARFHVPYPSIADPDGMLLLGFRGSLPPNAIPSTLVVDRQGDVAARVVGPVTYEGLRTLVQQVAAEQS